MRNKSLKVIISILLIFMILMLATETMATWTGPDRKEYLVASDLAFTNQIIVRAGTYAGRYYCINHAKRTLSKRNGRW